MGGQDYDFNSWSDGGAMAHNVIAATDLQLEAKFLSPLGAPPVMGESGSGAVCERSNATIIGTEKADRLVGTSAPDVIAGLGGKDTLIGKGGDDLICGGGGADSLMGGRGADLLKGGQGRDLCLAVQRSDLMPGCEQVRRH
jgi:Ca2+-binding RTX toxin-like protein